MPRRRLFVALLVPGAVADEVDGLRRALGSGEIGRIAPHVTLVPPVNVPEQDLAGALALASSAAASSGPVAVDLGPAATFWPAAPVCYLEVAGDLAALASLRAALVAAGGPLAAHAGRTERRFVPHVTLNQRVEPSRLPAALEALAHYEAAVTFEHLSVLEWREHDRRWAVIADAELGPPPVYARGGLQVEISCSSRLEPAAAAWADRAFAQYAAERYGPGWHPDQPFALVARVGGEVAGVAEGELRTRVARLARLIVAPAWRGHGVGSHLLSETERRALAYGSARVRLETPAGGEAEGFYRERGYAVVAVLPRWREERDFVLMERQLR